MISESEVLFWMSAASVSIAKQTKAIKYCGSITEIWDRMGSDDKLREIFDNKYDLALRYKSEQFIANCMEKLRASDVKVMSIFNPGTVPASFGAMATRALAASARESSRRET